MADHPVSAPSTRGSFLARCHDDGVCSDCFRPLPPGLGADAELTWLQEDLLGGAQARLDQLVSDWYQLPLDRADLLLSGLESRLAGLRTGAQRAPRVRAGPRRGVVGVSRVRYRYGQPQPGKCRLEVCDGTGEFWHDAEGRPVELDDDGDPVDPGRAVGRKHCECRPHIIEMRRHGRVLAPLPKRLRNISFDRNPVANMDRKQLAPIRKYIAELDANHGAGRGLWLAGPKGTGKTTLAALVMKHFLEAGYSAAFWPYFRLLERIQSTFDTADESVWDLRVQLEDLGLLVLDDIGREHPNEYAITTAHAVIDDRYNNDRPTIITTNLAEDELEARIGDGALDRLYETCGEPIRFDGPSYRRPAPAPVTLEAGAA